MNIQVNINLCRVCMKSDTGTCMLTDSKIRLKFECVTHLQVKKGDNLPAIICEKCILLLNLSFKFIQSAQETEKNLKAFLAKINNDFKLVTKSAPTKNILCDDANGMLEVLSGTEEENSSKSLVNTDVDKNGTLNTKKRNRSDLDDLGSFEGTYSPQQQGNNITDDDESRNTLDKGELDTKTVTDYLDLTEENSRTVDYGDVENILVTEGENSSEEQQPSNDDFSMKYEALLEDDTSTMDILYEDSENVFQTDTVQPAIETSVTVEEISVEMEATEATERDYIETERVVSQRDEVTETEIILDQDKEFVSRKRTIRNASMRKLNSSVAESTRFYCSKCNRDFSTKTNLTRHMQLHDSNGKRPYQCNICFKGFSQNGTLKQHMYIHTGEKPHVCSVCNRGFTQSKSLVFHMRRHTGEKPHQCDYCNSLFRQKDALKVHILKHHTDVGERAFSCKICNKEMSGQELRSHMKQHLNNHKTVKIDSYEIIPSAEDSEIIGEPVFVSDELLFDVDGSTHVIDIMATSTTEPSRAKKYQCRACFKCFAIKKNLIRHLSFHDISASDLPQCQICNLVFDTNYALKVHRVREHKETGIDLNECDECQVKFKNATDLSIHIQNTHTFTCSQCPQLSFGTKKHLNDHLLEHNIDEIEEDE